MKCFQIFTNADCNLRCKYCYEHNKCSSVSDSDIVKSYIDSIFSDKDIRNNINNTAIEFIGGETLLHPKLISGYIECILNNCGKYELSTIPEISLTTNGTILTDDVREFFHKYGRYISLGVSIDGTKECHDLNRVDIHGNGSYDKIVQNLEFIKKHVCINKLNCKATFNHDTIKYYKDSIINLINLGFTSIVANTVYEEYWTEKDQDMIYFQLKDVVDYLFDNNLEDKIIIQQINSNGLDCKALPFGVPRISNHCGSCEHMVCLGVDNKIYGCHRFATSFSRPVGIYNDRIVIDNKDFINEVKDQYLYYPEECNACDFINICGTCAALPYEFNITPKEWFLQKRQCGFTKAVGYAHVYYALKLKDKQSKKDTC